MAAFGKSLEQIVRERHRLRGRHQRADAGPDAAGDDATRTEDGWIVSGQKIFCTMSPAADVLYTAVTCCRPTTAASATATR